MLDSIDIMDNNTIIENIKNNYDLLMNSVSETNNLTYKFMNLCRDLPKQFDDITQANQVLNIINKRCKHYKIESYHHTENIANIKNIINDLFDDYENNENSNNELINIPINSSDESYCEYRGCCEPCLSEGSSKTQNYEYCKNKCVRCKEFRDQFLKREKKEARDFFMQYIPKTKTKANQPIELLTPIQINNINTINNIDTIINNTVINNFIQVNISILEDLHTFIPNISSIEDKKYLFTKDRFFNITIQAQSSTEEAINNLKHIFINLICGAAGKKFFPSELIYSTAVTYTVKSALYTIINHNNLPVLLGILRYEHILNKTTIMSVKKLEALNTTNKKTPTIIKASKVALWEDKKHHHSLEHINLIITNIIKTPYYGSDIKSFVE